MKPIVLQQIIKPLSIPSLLKNFKMSEADNFDERYLTIICLPPGAPMFRGCYVHHRRYRSSGYNYY